ncbi:MAG: right-handed parallel beta-helix repeat-containing protein [Phycisphaerales bacterium]|nr:right-handed parallel beta-helix repeat-containing protein [Phycisphaerales bacterium]
MAERSCGFMGLLAALGVLCGVLPALGQTDVGGIIDQDTVWTLAESPYIATQDVEVVEGAVLTIEPGVEVAFEADTALNAEMGVLIADGQGGGPIVLRSVSGDVGGWQGVVCTLDVPAITTPEGEYVSGPILRNVHISEAVRAVQVGLAPTHLEDVDIERCSEAGVYFFYDMQDPTMWLKDVSVRDAGIGALFRGGSSIFYRLVLHDCVFEDNPGGGFRMPEFDTAGGEMLRCVFRRNGVGGSSVAGGGAFLVGGWDLRECVFEENESNDTREGGGGLALNPRLPSAITDCEFRANTSVFSGGGVEVRLTSPFGTDFGLRIERTRFIGNRSSGSSGGGMLVSYPVAAASLEILDCVFAENDGESNGALAMNARTAIIEGNTFERNSAVDSAGAIRFISGANPDAYTIKHNAFIENSTEAAGGAIDQAGRNIRNFRIESNVFRGNTADLGGALGGILPMPTTEIVGNVFEGNSARLGGAVHFEVLSTDADMLAAEGDLVNRFTGNAADFGADIYNDTRANIGATGNCWGTDDLAAIADRIFDAADDPSKGVVTFDPIATDCDDCPADLDGDGRLTLFDFLAFQTLFDAGDAAADFDGDGRLTLFDFLAFQTAFDTGCE